MLQGPKGKRTLQAADFFAGTMETALAPDELLTEIRVPALPEGTGWGFQEAARRQGDFALVAVAVLLRPSGAQAASMLASWSRAPARGRRVCAKRRRSSRARNGRRCLRGGGQRGGPSLRTGGRPPRASLVSPEARGRAHPPRLPRGGHEDGALNGGPRATAVRVTINGEAHEGRVEPRLLLSDFIRHEAGLTGTHVGCEHGVCGACTVLLDGAPVRSCLMFAVQADGASVETVESLADGETLHPLQEAFRREHGLQCGYCTPGILMTLKPFLAANPAPSDAEIRQALSGNLCRCTGYQQIVAAVRRAAATLRGEEP